MANIIEREIEKREIIIQSKEDKELEIEELEVKLTVLKNEVAGINVAELEAEIEELKTYLPKDEEISISEAY